MQSVKRLCAHSLVIFIIAAGLGFLVNTLRSDGVPLVRATSSAVEINSESGEIALKDAILLFASKRAVFVDARSWMDFEEGRIQGAVSLPLEEFDDLFESVQPEFDNKEAVIVYCDGVKCPLSHEVADLLREKGVINALVLKNGWSLWRQESLPVEP